MTQRLRQLGTTSTTVARATHPVPNIQFLLVVDSSCDLGLVSWCVVHRGLYMMNLTQQARYLASNSGGSWFNSAFSYQVGCMQLVLHTAAVAACTTGRFAAQRNALAVSQQ